MDDTHRDDLDEPDELDELELLDGLTDICQALDALDTGPVGVRGTGHLGEQGRHAIGEIIRAAQRMHTAQLHAEGVRRFADWFEGRYAGAPAQRIASLARAYADAIEHGRTPPEHPGTLRMVPETTRWTRRCREPH